MNELINKIQAEFDRLQSEIDRLTNDKMQLAQQLFAEQAKAIDNTTRNTPREMIGKTALSNMVHVVAHDNQVSEASIWMLLANNTTCKDIEKLIALTQLPPLRHEDNY
jgi:flagellin-like hook-associated protein FlgL